MFKKQSLKLGFTSFLVLCACSGQSPVNPETDGLVALELNFVGRPVRTHFLSKTAAHPFTHLMLEIYEKEITADSPADLAPLATATIEIDPAATTFEGRLALPAGDKRVLLARLFETAGEASALSDSTVVSYCGKIRDLSILPGQVNEIVLDLFPAPIKHRRVVFWLESVQISPEANTAQIPVRIATLDSLRGFQFDLAFEPPRVSTDSISKNDAARLFSTIQFNDIPGARTRILMFDQTPGSPWIVPLANACAPPVSLIGVHVRWSEHQEIIQVTMEQGIVSAQNFKDLEVYAIPAQIIQKSN
jgi:hypothetical protein